ncbi:hypothetical protein BBJ28_00027260 [Nothophytophthora sp. Chile5]|nr:hypothetical protein BBJ28_00027260 [Nothophytophthora sp. Chile5]
MAPSSSAFAVTARKVPPLALVPRSRLQASKRAAALAKPPPAALEPAGQQQHEAGRRPARRQAPEDEEKTLLRLGERFLNVMALMARLARQPLSDDGASPAPEPQRDAHAVVAAAASPVHVVRAVGERVPPALRDQLTFDICTLLPAPQSSPLHSPIRRKRLRKCLRRRRRRRPRRSWQASYVSWVPHASADYIEHHARQDVAAASAARLVGRLQDHQVQDQRLLPGKTTLPPLDRSGRQHASKVADDDEREHDDHDDHDDHASDEAVPKRSHHDEADETDDDEHDQEDEADADDQEDEVDDDDDQESEAEDDDDQEVSWSHDDSHVGSPHMEARGPPPSSARTAAAASKKPPLYHQPAWISPELRAWLVASGLFSTRPRRELLPPGV